MRNKTRATAFQHLEARQDMLSRQFYDINNRITGRDNNFLMFITNKDGKVSEGKLDNFIQELLNSVFDTKIYGIITNVEFKELCECFLYCTIQGIVEYDEKNRCVERLSCNFSDIVDMARHKNNLLFSEVNTLHKYEYETAQSDEADEDFDVKFINELQWGGFFRCGDVAYRILTGRSITVTFTNEEYITLYDADMLKTAQAYGFDTVEEYLEWDEEMTDAEKDFDFLQNPEGVQCMSKSKKYTNEIIELRKRKNDEWRRMVVSLEQFIEKYLRFRELFFKLDMYYRYNLFEYVEFMVDMFLYNHNLSMLSNDESFAMIYYRTNKLSAAIQHEIEKNKTYNSQKEKLKNRFKSAIDRKNATETQTSDENDPESE